MICVCVCLIKKQSLFFLKGFGGGLLGKEGNCNTFFVIVEEIEIGRGRTLKVNNTNAYNIYGTHRLNRNSKLVKEIDNILLNWSCILSCSNEQHIYIQIIHLESHLLEDCTL